MPLKLTVPPAGRDHPKMMLKRVVFPAPFGPIRDVMVPRRPRSSCRPQPASRQNFVDLLDSQHTERSTQSSAFVKARILAPSKTSAPSLSSPTPAPGADHAAFKVMSS